MTTDTLPPDILAIRAATCSDAARIAVRAMEQRDEARAELADLRESLGDAEISHRDDAPEFAVESPQFGVTLKGEVYLKAGEWIVHLANVEDDLGQRLAKVWGRWEDATTSTRATDNRDYFSTRGAR